MRLISFCWMAMTRTIRREAANPGDKLSDASRGVQQEKIPGKHVNTRGHHGRGMNQRADGRWALHRVPAATVPGKLTLLAIAPQKISRPDRGEGPECLRMARVYPGAPES